MPGVLYCLLPTQSILSGNRTQFMLHFINFDDNTHTHTHTWEREREREREGGRERPGHTLPHPNCTRQLFSEVSILFLVASSVFGQPTTWVGIILYILYEFPLVENGEFSHDITLFTWLWVKIVRINIKKLIMTGFSPNYLLKILVQIKYCLCVREYLYLVIDLKVMQNNMTLLERARL
jgi:hypothetical protein